MKKLFKEIKIGNSMHFVVVIFHWMSLRHPSKLVCSKHFWTFIDDFASNKTACFLFKIHLFILFYKSDNLKTNPSGFPMYFQKGNLLWWQSEPTTCKEHVIKHVMFTFSSKQLLAKQNLKAQILKLVLNSLVSFHNITFYGFF
jgi:hypothetical protein